MVNCNEFLQHTLSNFDCELWCISTTHLVISTVNCGEFLQHSPSNFDGRLR